MLTKDQKRLYKKLIAEKLEEFGVKDEIHMRQIGIRAGSRAPVYQARNLQRNIIKTLLKGDVESIEKFLKSELKMKETPGAT